MGWKKVEKKIEWPCQSVLLRSRFIKAQKLWIEDISIPEKKNPNTFFSRQFKKEKKSSKLSGRIISNGGGEIILRIFFKDMALYTIHL